MPGMVGTTMQTAINKHIKSILALPLPHPPTCLSNSIVPASLFRPADRHTNIFKRERKETPAHVICHAHCGLIHAISGLTFSRGRFGFVNAAGMPPNGHPKAVGKRLRQRGSHANIRGKGKAKEGEKSTFTDFGEAFYEEFFVPLQRNSQRVALQMTLISNTKVALFPIVMNWGHLENWKSTASV